MEKDTSVKVAVRIRPLNEDELHQDGQNCIQTIPNASQIIAGSDQYFTFDHVFSSDSEQVTIFNDCVEELLEAAFEGFNATILAYGQTGSGKTWTMGSSSELNLAPEFLGIIPRVIRNLFDTVKEREKADPNSAYKISVQFLEIYGEDIRDLLDQTRTSKVTIRETAEGEVFVAGAREELVSSAEQMMKALEDGTKHRTTAATRMNQTSSRSHAIFTVILEHIIYNEALLEDSEETAPDYGPYGIDTELENEYQHNHIPKRNIRLASTSARHAAQQEVRKCKFHFVDLAGSERAKRTGAQGLQLKEGIDINKGLLALGNVISALGDEQKRGKVFVPYRDSKLTRILQDSLGGNSKTLMICCVSPSVLNYHESVNALRYANRARNIKNKPMINRDPTLIIIDELRSQLKAVASELLAMRKTKQYVEDENNLSVEVLENFIDLNEANQFNKFSTVMSKIPSKNGIASHSSNQSPIGGPIGSNVFSTNRPGLPKATSNTNERKLSEQMKKFQQENTDLQGRLRDGDYEIQRLNEQLKLAKQQCSEYADQMVLAKSEVDFYKMKWADVNPAEAQKLEALSRGEYVPSDSDDDSDAPPASTALKEKANIMNIFAEHLKEIDELKKKINQQQLQIQLGPSGAGDISNGIDANALLSGRNSLEHGILFDEQMTNSVAVLISKTRNELRREAQRLRKIERMSVDVESDEEESENEEDVANGKESGLNEENKVPGNGLILDVHRKKIKKPKANLSPQSSLGAEEDFLDRDEEEEELAFHKRQSLLATEVNEMGKSIALKEQLLIQLQKSQYQYNVMKTFYEQKLIALGTEIKDKQTDRDRLYQELQSVTELKTEEMNVKQQDKERKLREELHRKDLELQTIRKKQDEINQLSQAPSKYNQQLNRLQTDITVMKKQKVDLTKELQNEKKVRLNAIREKALEIEKLKKELSKNATEMKKLERNKEIAERQARDAIRDGEVLRKKNIMGKETYPPVMSTTRAAVRAMNRVSRLGNANKRILTEEELRTKKWLDKRIAEISAREAAAEALKRQYEHKLELLHRRDTLEAEKASAILESASKTKFVKFDYSEPDQQVVPTDHETNSTLLLTSNEEMKLLEIEEQLTSLNGQISLKNQQINDIQNQLAIISGGNENDQLNGNTISTERTIEVLKGTAAGSLPASHQLIRLLFDMLVNATTTIQHSFQEAEELNDHVLELKHELEDAQGKLTAAKRIHDMEVMKTVGEYEAKIETLFNNFRMLHGIEKGSIVTAVSMGNLPVPPTSDSFTDDKENNAFNSILDIKLNGILPAPATAIPITGTYSMPYDALKIHLELSTLELETLRRKLTMETQRQTDWQAKVDELEYIKFKLNREIEEKNRQIKFLEEDRSLFKDLADDFKAGLATMGKTGKNIIDTVKDRVASATKKSLNGRGPGLLYSVSFGRESTEYDLDDEEEDDIDSESIIGQYDFIAQEIQRTGAVTSYRPMMSNEQDTGGASGIRPFLPSGGLSSLSHHNSIPISNSANTATLLSSSLTSNSSSSSARAEVYERLTNPSNFTGSMKKVFESGDIEYKRKKVQQNRSSITQQLQTNGGGGGGMDLRSKSLDKNDQMSSASSKGGLKLIDPDLLQDDISNHRLSPDKTSKKSAQNIQRKSAPVTPTQTVTGRKLSPRTGVGHDPPVKYFEDDAKIYTKESYEDAYKRRVLNSVSVPIRQKSITESKSNANHSNKSHYIMSKKSSMNNNISKQKNSCEHEKGHESSSSQSSPEQKSQTTLNNLKTSSSSLSPFLSVIRKSASMGNYYVRKSGSGNNGNEADMKDVAVVPDWVDDNPLHSIVKSRKSSTLSSPKYQSKHQKEVLHRSHSLVDENDPPND